MYRYIARRGNNDVWEAMKCLFQGSMAGGTPDLKRAQRLMEVELYIFFENRKCKCNLCSEVTKRKFS
jgi:hypothetical protein